MSDDTVTTASAWPTHSAEVNVGARCVVLRYLARKRAERLRVGDVEPWTHCEILHPDLIVMVPRADRPFVALALKELAHLQHIEHESPSDAFPFGRARLLEAGQHWLSAEMRKLAVGDAFSPTRVLP